jgi:long-chain acyl-CoA synthetase
MAVGATRVRGLGRVMARVARHVEVALAEVDLHPSQYRTLVFLAGGPANASLLADWLAMKRPSLTAVMDSLVARGLVERDSDPNDRRRVGHHLTSEGKKTLRRADAAVERRLGEVLAFGRAEDADLVAQSLDVWEDALDGFREAANARYER